jgi:hypothetical protein
MVSTPTTSCWLSSRVSQGPAATTTTAKATTPTTARRCIRRAHRWTRWAEAPPVTRRTTATMTAEPGIETIRNSPVRTFKVP